MSGSKTHIKKQPTSDDMEQALTRLKSVAHCLILLPDDDDPIAVMAALKDEVLQLRAMKADMVAMVQEWSVKLGRR